METLQSSLVRLRVPLADDAERWYVLFNDQRVMRFIGDGQIASQAYYDGFVARQRQAFADTRLCLFAVEVAGEVAGFCGLQQWRQPWGPAGAVEMGWRFGAQHWGKGLAHEAGQLVVRYAREQHLDKIVAMINVGNRRSTRLATSLGFSPASEYLSPGNATVACYTQEL